MSPGLSSRASTTASRTPGGASSRLDLAELDAEAADLDLVVDAPEELDVRRRAGSAPRSPVRYMRAPAARERIGDEALGGQLRTVQIAARQPRAADVQLARHADRHRLAMPIQKIDAGVGDRTADGHAAAGRAKASDVETTMVSVGP